MDSSTEVVYKPAPLRLRFLHVLRAYVATCARYIFAWYYGNEGERIPPIKDEILKLPAVEVAKRIRNKEITSVEVTEACIRRIQDVNPALNCFVEDRFDVALDEARQADDLVRKGTTSSEQLLREKPLLGVPFTTKDCICVKGLHNTAGVFIRKDVIAEDDAEAIRLLRENGAIPIGLTNVPELCMWWETHNYLHGRTNNPYNTTRIVGGSSGGEACLQAAGGSVFGIGSDIGGSIRMPAYFNGIFGHKPTRYTVSNVGQYPSPGMEIQNSFLGIGPMTRFAVDLKPILKIISGDKSKELKLDEHVDITKIKVFYQFENKAPVIDKLDPELKSIMKKVVDHLGKISNTTPEEMNIKLLQKSAPIWMVTMKNNTTFSKLITGKDSSTFGIVTELLKNLFGYSKNTFIGLATALTDNTGVQIGSERYKHYLKLREDLENTFTTMLGDTGVFIYPTHPTPAPYHNEPLLKVMNFCYTSIINCLGLPATQVPLGLNKEGLPLGLQVVANHNNDRLCLAVAEELEKHFRGWVEPQSG